MLGKLCKHEIKATSRWFLPLFAIALVLTPITRLTFSFGRFEGVFRFIPGVITFAYVVSLIAIGVASVLLVVLRFYKSMVTDEGYLTHTLPVTTGQLIWSKLIIASMWSVASILVITLSLFLMFFTPGNMAYFIRGLREMFEAIGSYAYGGRMILIVTEAFIVMLIGIFTAPLVYYASIAIGQVISKNKVLGSIAGYFLIQIASQIIFTIGMVSFAHLINRFDNLLEIDKQLVVVSNIFFPILILGSIISAAVLFFITHYVFKNKLNLE